MLPIRAGDSEGSRHVIGGRGSSVPYPIEVERGALSRVGAFVRETAPAHRYAVITDSHVGPLYGRAVAQDLGIEASDILAVPAGEASKTRGTWGWLTDQLIERGFGRDSAIVALGGGVVGDLAGFVAATYMRGIAVVHVPTTLLAMIDASIGGKTGVDTVMGKNLVGSFHSPKGVLIDPQVLDTLEVTHLRTGFAEAVKHGVIADREYFQSVAALLPRLKNGWEPAGDAGIGLIVGSIEIKASIVARDEHEDGIRKILNFGHTIGHALEHLSGYKLAHGEAVAIGMVLESRIAELAGLAEDGLSNSVRLALNEAGLPVERPGGMSVDAIVEVTRGDKKARAGAVRYALPRRIGEMSAAESGWTVEVDEATVREVLT